MSDHGELTLDEVTTLLVAKIREVMALEGEVSLDARFDEDLHADSLDLVEVIEGLERELGKRGAEVSMSDEELLTLTTVREAAERIHAGTGQESA